MVTNKFKKGQRVWFFHRYTPLEAGYHLSDTYVESDLIIKGWGKIAHIYEDSGHYLVVPEEMGERNYRSSVVVVPGGWVSTEELKGIKVLYGNK